MPTVQSGGDCHDYRKEIVQTQRHHLGPPLWM